jgi:hypothetical protein
VAETVYNGAKTITPVNGATYGILLLKTTAAGAFNPDLDFVSDLLAVGTVAECDFTNYARKTFTITAATDDANNRANFDAANQTWTAAGGATNNTPVAAVIYGNTAGADSAKTLISYHDTGFGSVATNGGDFTINITDFMRVA